jgi:hypothetical protein
MVPAILTMAERNSTFCQIVGREFEGDFIAGQNADAVAPQAAGQVGEHDPLMFQLHAELAAGELLEDGSGNFNAIVFAHIPLAG